MTGTIYLSVALALAMAASPLWAGGLSDEVQQRRDAELRALQLQIQQQQQTGPTVEASPQRKLRIEQWRRNQQSGQLQLYLQQQRQRRLQPPQPALQPPQLRPTPQDTTREDAFRRQREIQRLQRQPPPSR